MSKVYASLRYHLIFGTKDRHPMIIPSLKERLYSYMSGIIVQRRGVVLEVDGIEDHVHILAGLPPTLAVAQAVKAIKGGSSWWVSNQWSPGHAFKWQPGYGAFTVSESQIRKVRKYIRNQHNHHRSRSFEEELHVYRKRHGLTPELAALIGPESSQTRP